MYHSVHFIPFAIHNKTCGPCLYTNGDDGGKLEVFYMGLVSLALTILNILSISVIGWLTLRLKEVTPEKIPQQFSSFWRKDIRLHRDYVSTVIDRKNTILQEAREVLGVSDSDDDCLEKTFMNTIYDKIKHDEEYINIQSDIQRLFSVPATKIEATEVPGYLTHNYPINTTHTSIHELFDNNLNRQKKSLVKLSLQNLKLQHENSVKTEQVINCKEYDEPLTA